MSVLVFISRNLEVLLIVRTLRKIFLAGFARQRIIDEDGFVCFVNVYILIC